MYFPILFLNDKRDNCRVSKNIYNIKIRSKQRKLGRKKDSTRRKIQNIIPILSKIRVGEWEVAKHVYEHPGSMSKMLFFIRTKRNLSGQEQHLDQQGQKCSEKWQVAS